RPIVLVVQRHDVFTFDTRQRLGRTGDWVAVSGITKNYAGGDITSKRARAIHSHAQAVEILLAQALDLFILEGGVANDVRKYRHRRLGLGRDYVDRNPRGIPRRARVEDTAKRFDFLSNLRRGARLRALGEKAAGHVGNAAQSGWVDFAAVFDHQLRG